MKLFYSQMLLFVSCLLLGTASAQDISINVQTAGTGVVPINGNVLIEMQISNNDAASSLANYKIRPRLTVPSTVSIATSGHILPPGFTIVSQTSNVITLSNGTNNIMPSETVSAFINVTGGPSMAPSQTVLGSLFFSNGNAPGSVNGAATAGDISANNSSTTTVEVIGTTPVTLLSFSGAIKNCQTILQWTTSTEINSDRFEIERATQNIDVWTSLAVTPANGNSITKIKYSFSDNNLPQSAEKVFYRLKIVDRNGGYKYSAITSLTSNCKTKELYVFPNPVENGNLQFNVTGVTKNTEATLLAADGKTVARINVSNGNNSINVASIAAGTYILKMQYEDGTSKNVRVIIKP